MWLRGVLVGLLYARSLRCFTNLGLDFKDCESAGCSPVPENVICGLGAKAGASISDDRDFLLFSYQHHAFYFTRGISWIEEQYWFLLFVQCSPMIDNTLGTTLF